MFLAFVGSFPPRMSSFCAHATQSVTSYNLLPAATHCQPFATVPPAQPQVGGSLGIHGGLVPQGVTHGLAPSRNVLFPAAFSTKEVTRRSPSLQLRSLGLTSPLWHVSFLEITFFGMFIVTASITKLVCVAEKTLLVNTVIVSAKEESAASWDKPS